MPEVTLLPSNRLSYVSDTGCVYAADRIILSWQTHLASQNDAVRLGLHELRGMFNS